MAAAPPLAVSWYSSRGSGDSNNAVELPPLPRLPALLPRRSAVGPEPVAAPQWAHQPGLGRLAAERVFSCESVSPARAKLTLMSPRVTGRINARRRVGMRSIGTPIALNRIGTREMARCGSPVLQVAPVVAICNTYNRNDPGAELLKGLFFRSEANRAGINSEIRDSSRPAFPSQFTNGRWNPRSTAFLAAMLGPSDPQFRG